MNSKRERVVYLDAMRIIAIFLVLFNHSSGHKLYQISGGPKQWIYMFITMVTEINVPLFLMISGTLLLDKEEAYKTLLCKRVLRFASVIVLFEFGLYVEYYVGALLKGDESANFSFFKFIQGVFARSFDGTMSYGIVSYWYLYAYIGMLLTLPFLRRIAKQMDKKDFIFLVSIHFVVSTLLPIINIIMKAAGGEGGLVLSGDLSIPFATTTALFYPLMGYYLDRCVDITTFDKRRVVQLISIASVGILISSICTYYEGETMGGYTQNYVSLFNYVTAIVAFLVIKYFFVVCWKSIHKNTARMLAYVGSLTFGVYLLEPYLRAIFYKRFVNLLEPILPVLIVSFLWCIVGMLVGGSITALLKKIPYVRQLL